MERVSDKDSEPMDQLYSQYCAVSPQQKSPREYKISIIAIDVQ